MRGAWAGVLPSLVEQGGDAFQAQLQDFPSACFVPCQGPEHPNPGKKFTARGFPRHCYLPDNEKGRKVSDLLPTPPGVSPALERCPEESRALDSNQGAVP